MQKGLRSECLNVSLVSHPSRRLAGSATLHLVPTRAHPRSRTHSPLPRFRESFLHTLDSAQAQTSLHPSLLACLSPHCSLAGCCTQVPHQHYNVLIVSELHVGDVVDPFIGSVSTVNSKVCFDNLIHLFGSSISLWMVSCAHEQFGVTESD